MSDHSAPRMLKMAIFTRPTLTRRDASCHSTARSKVHGARSATCVAADGEPAVS